jgi:hypothetical protein
MASVNPLLTLERMLNGKTTLKTQKTTHSNIICKLLVNQNHLFIIWDVNFLIIFVFLAQLSLYLKFYYCNKLHSELSLSYISKNYYQQI